MRDEMVTRSVSLDELEIDWDGIWQESGFRGYVPDESAQRLYREVVDEVRRRVHPMYGYASYLNEGSDWVVLRMGGVCFQAGGIISRYLYEADEFIVFVATAGREFESLQRELGREGDIVKQFMADMIGSEIAEATGNLLSRTLEKIQSDRGLGVSNRYSPGYCGWPVAEQRKLFTLLPPAPCGITLTDSCLMLPIKSISGVMAVGSCVEKRPYGCAICGRKDCYKNRLRKAEKR